MRFCIRTEIGTGMLPRGGLGTSYSLHISFTQDTRYVSHGISSLCASAPFSLIYFCLLISFCSLITSVGTRSIMDSLGPTSRAFRLQILPLATPVYLYSFILISKKKNPISLHDFFRSHKDTWHLTCLPVIWMFLGHEPSQPQSAVAMRTGSHTKHGCLRAYTLAAQWRETQWLIPNSGWEWRDTGAVK